MKRRSCVPLAGRKEFPGPKFPISQGGQKPRHPRKSAAWLGRVFLWKWARARRRVAANLAFCVLMTSSVIWSEWISARPASTWSWPMWAERSSRVVRNPPMCASRRMRFLPAAANYILEMAACAGMPPRPNPGHRGGGAGSGGFFARRPGCSSAHARMGKFSHP